MVRKTFRILVLIAVGLVVGQMTVGNKTIGTHFDGAVGNALGWCKNQWMRCEPCSRLLKKDVFKTLSKQTQAQPLSHPTSKAKIKPRALVLPRPPLEEKEKKISAADRDSMIQLLP